jgi:hypothetical protein
MTILCPVPLLATVVAGVAVVLATVAVLLLILRPVLGNAFTGVRFGAALVGLLVLLARLPLLLSE